MTCRRVSSDQRTYGDVSVPMETSAYLCRCQRTYGDVSVPMEMSAYLWRCQHTYGDVSIPMEMSAYLWRCQRTYGDVSVPMEMPACEPTRLMLVCEMAPMRIWSKARLKNAAKVLMKTTARSRVAHPMPTPTRFCSAMNAST